MTSPRRFEQDVPALLADLYLAGTPDYRDDLVRQVARVRQRPAWTFFERWLPMDLVTERVPTPRVPWRALGVLTLIALLIAATLAAYIGSQPRLPAPFGLAANGSIAYASGGDILVRDDAASPARILIGGATDDHDPWYAPDGMRLLFVRTIDLQDFLMIASTDGSRSRPLVAEPLRGAFIAMAPDSRAMAIVNEVKGQPTLSLVSLLDGTSQVIDTGPILPSDLAWQPPDGAKLLIRGRKADMTTDFFTVNADGTGFRGLGLPGNVNFGPDWDNSGPAWSLDGQSIYYNVVEKLDPPANGQFRVHEVNADGTGDHALPGPVDPLVQEAWPVLSPDGQSVLVHRWTWGEEGFGWLAVMPADGSAPAHMIGPKIAGGDKTGLIKIYSPDGSRVLVRAENTKQVFSIDPVTGAHEELDWSATNLPDWQRRAP
jgi:hypothetical protein